MRDPGADARYAWVLRNGAHLSALSAFALAQPIFDILGRNPEFFAVRASTAREIVLFALVVTFALPLALVTIELAVSVVSRALQRGLQWFFVGALTAVIALHVVAKTELLTGTAALLAAVAAGAAGAVLYWRASAVRSFLDILAVAPIAFLLLFLVNSPVSRLVFTETAEAKTVTVHARTPVVVVVFDELPTASLMDGADRVDARRWPNFASLARNSTWFRSATTVHGHTTYAVPAILDAKLPKPGRLPILADHPDNLFTFLGDSHQLRVIESETHLCPPSLCDGATVQDFDPGASDRTRSLAFDVGVVYLSMLLPKPYLDRLPPISNTWGNFGGAGQDDSQPDESDRPVRAVPACSRGICDFASLVTPDREPTLYFLHALLPHVPWLYLPSGKHYGGDVRVIPGDQGGRWVADAWLTTQARQRYLLQLGYTDRALGVVLRRLRAAGVYDRALVVVTADHGMAFRPDAPARNVTRANLADVAFVPLFVKLPGQKRGRIDDSYARNIDVLPTIARVLRARIPWRVDGKPLIGHRLPTDGIVRLSDARGRPVAASLRTLLAERGLAVEQLHAVFGTGPLGRVYRIGPHRGLLGRSVGTLDVRASEGSRVELDAHGQFQVVDLSTSLVPNYVTGIVTSGDSSPQNLAISVNGTVRATTRTFASGGATRFAALVPEHVIRDGANEIRVFALRTGPKELVLTELERRDAGFLLSEATRTSIESADGAKIRVVPGALKGQLRVLRPGDSVTLGGWAANPVERRAAESVVVFVDRRSVFVGRPGNTSRNDSRHYGIKGTDFVFRLPKSLFPAPRSSHRVRIFAISGALASEFAYPPRYPWLR